MKILSKNKIIVSALALCIGASLAGSVSGTIAWYQYSTRANVAFIGEAGGFSGNLQMRFLSEASDETAWRTKISWQEMNNELADGGYAQKIVPMTFGAMDKDQALPANGYMQPRPGVAAMTDWVKAEKKNYAQFQLQLRYNQRNGENSANVSKDVYLTKVLIKKDANNGEKGDISDAIRVHISSSDGSNIKNKLISNPGKEMATKGALDIDGDGRPDKAYPDGDEFGFAHEDTDLVDIIYGDDGDDATSEVQTSYKADATDAADGVYPALVYEKNNILYNNSQANSSPESTKSIGKTVAGTSGYLNVTVTIWVEGWQKFDNAQTAIWDTKYINSKFDVGIQFAVQDAFVQE